jgi:hypothetical protein
MMIKFNLSLSLDSVSVTNKDSVFLTGSCKQLGEWNLNKAIEMRPKPGDDTGSVCSNSSLNENYNENL